MNLRRARSINFQKKLPPTEPCGASGCVAAAAVPGSAASQPLAAGIRSCVIRTPFLQAEAVADVL